MRQAPPVQGLLSRRRPSPSRTRAPREPIRWTHLLHSSYDTSWRRSVLYEARVVAASCAALPRSARAPGAIEERLPLFRACGDEEALRRWPVTSRLAASWHRLTGKSLRW